MARRSMLRHGRCHSVRLGASVLSLLVVGARMRRPVMVMAFDYSGVTASRATKRLYAAAQQSFPKIPVQRVKRDAIQRVEADAYNGFLL